MNKTDPIQQLCFQGDVPVYPYVVAITGHRTFNSGSEFDTQLPCFSEETIKATFKQLLTSIATRWKKESDGVAPLILLTGMADGADQIAAETALELKELNVKVLAVLPMERSIYLNTIENKERFNNILEQVTGIYELPLVKDNIGKETELCDCDEKNEKAEKCRQLQYEEVADFLALHSHAMFAIWDGIDHPVQKGGTSCAVRFKLEGDSGDCEQQHNDPLTFPSVGPVVQIMVTRKDEKNQTCPYPELLRQEKTPPVFVWTREHTSPENRSEVIVSDRITNLDKIADEKVFTDVLPRLGKANRDSHYYYKRIESQLDDSQTYLGIPGKEFDSHNLDNETGILIRHYTVMDTLSSFFQKSATNIIKLYVIVLFFFMFIGGYLASVWSIRENGWGNIPETLFYFLWDNQSESPFDCMFIATMGFWLFFLLLLGTYFWAWYRQYHRRYHRYRTLAEALRVQIFWRIAGMSHAVSGYYRSHQVNDLSWLRCALNGIDVLLSSPHSVSENLHSRIDYVQECWMNKESGGQIPYFKGAIQKRREPWGKKKDTNNDLKDKVKTHERKTLKQKFKLFMDWIFLTLYYIAEKKYIKIPLLGLFTILLVSQPVMDNFTETIFRIGNETDDALCLIVAFGISCSFLTSLIFVALLYVQLMRFEQEAARYERMLYPYTRASILLDRKKKTLPSAVGEERNKILEDCQDILCNLGTEALSENAEWLLSVGERELTLPR